MNASLILIIILSYLIGSISGGIIVGKFRNIDIRKEGSKAAGATNAFRTMGIMFALIVVIIDVYKGFFATKYIPYFLNNNSIEMQILAGISCVIGHVYPIYFKFKGGKGVGTALGVCLAFSKLLPFILIAIFCWIFTLIMTGYVGLSSMLATLSIPLQYTLNNHSLYESLGIFSILITIFIIFAHRENINRMLNGTENQFKKIMITNLFKKKNG